MKLKSAITVDSFRAACQIKIEGSIQSQKAANNSKYRRSITNPERLRLNNIVFGADLDAEGIDYNNALRALLGAQDSEEFYAIGLEGLRAIFPQEEFESHAEALTHFQDKVLDFIGSIVEQSGTRNILEPIDGLNELCLAIENQILKAQRRFESARLNAQKATEVTQLQESSQRDLQEREERITLLIANLSKKDKEYSELSEKYNSLSRAANEERKAASLERQASISAQEKQKIQLNTIREENEAKFLEVQSRFQEQLMQQRQEAEELERVYKVKVLEQDATIQQLKESEAELVEQNGELNLQVERLERDLEKSGSYSVDLNKRLETLKARISKLELERHDQTKNAKEDSLYIDELVKSSSTALGSNIRKSGYHSWVGQLKLIYQNTIASQPYAIDYETVDSSKVIESLNEVRRFIGVDQEISFSQGTEEESCFEIAFKQLFARIYEKSGRLGGVLLTELEGDGFAEKYHTFITDKVEEETQRLEYVLIDKSVVSSSYSAEEIRAYTNSEEIQRFISDMTKLRILSLFAVKSIEREIGIINEKSILLFAFSQVSESSNNLNENFAKLYHKILAEGRGEILEIAFNEENFVDLLKAFNPYNPTHQYAVLEFFGYNVTPSLSLNREHVKERLANVKKAYVKLISDYTAEQREFFKNQTDSLGEHIETDHYGKNFVVPSCYDANVQSYFVELVNNLAYCKKHSFELEQFGHLRFDYFRVGQFLESITQVKDRRVLAQMFREYSYALKDAAVNETILDVLLDPKEDLQDLGFGKDGVLETLQFLLAVESFTTSVVKQGVEVQTIQNLKKARLENGAGGALDKDYKALFNKLKRTAREENNFIDQLDRVLEDVVDVEQEREDQEFGDDGFVQDRGTSSVQRSRSNSREEVDIDVFLRQEDEDLAEEKQTHPFVQRVKSNSQEEVFVPEDYDDESKSQDTENLSEDEQNLTDTIVNRSGSTSPTFR